MTDKTNVQRFPILAFFEYAHLPLKLQAISKPLSTLAHALAGTPTDHPAELAAGLRKLLEAKDCLVRAALPGSGAPIPKDG